MKFPSEFKFTKEHEWISAVSGKANVGVSAYAVEQLGDVVHVELPEVGVEFETGATFGTIESTKTVSDLYMPVAGRVSDVNHAIKDRPETLQEDAYRWLIKVEVRRDAASSHLLNASEYATFVAKQDH